MTIIFLDVDGVLNSIDNLIKTYSLTNKPHSGYEYPFDDKCMQNLVKLVKQTNAKIVITSSWRKDQKGINKLLKILNMYNLADLVIGYTPNLNMIRGEEIKFYLEKSNVKIDRFVIIDDDSDMGELTPFLVKTNTQTGLVYEDVIKAINVLFQSFPLSKKYIKNKVH